jgi:hypothetical protein
MALSQNNNLQNELTIEESIFALRWWNLKVIFIYKTMKKKRTAVYALPKTPWNYSARLKGDFNVKGLITVLQLF